MLDSPTDAGPATRLRAAALRLAAELDQARLYRAAAYVSMAADAASFDRLRMIGEAVPAAQLAVELRTDVECEFELDEHGRVWMIREGDCHIIGRRNAVCAEMRRFLASVVLGETH